MVILRQIVTAMILRLCRRLTAEVSGFVCRTHVLESSRRCLTTSSSSWASIGSASSKAVVEYDLPPRSQTPEGQIVLDKALRIIAKWVGSDLRLSTESHCLVTPPPTHTNHPHRHAYHHLPASLVWASCEKICMKFMSALHAPSPISELFHMVAAETILSRPI